MRDVGIVGSEKVSVPVTLSLKMSPKERHHSGSFTFFFPPLN